jgi:hypothetical protein
MCTELMQRLVVSVGPRVSTAVCVLLSGIWLLWQLQPEHAISLHAVAPAGPLCFVGFFVGPQCICSATV